MENAAPKRRGRARKNFDERPQMRPEIREDDSRAAAERRAMEIMNGIDDTSYDATEFNAPKAPDGWTYEWKRHSTFNQEDPSYQTTLAQTGWEPVPLNRHPQMMPTGHKGDNIIRKGMMLMQRPEIVTQKVKEREVMNARRQVKFKEEQLSNAPQGQFGRDHAQAAPKINKSYEPIPIPKE